MWRVAKIRGLQPQQGRIDVNEAPSGGLQENPQRAGDGKTSTSGQLRAPAFIDQQEIGSLFLRQLNRLTFAGVQLGERWIRRCQDFSDFQPRRLAVEPGTNDGGRLRMREFRDHGSRNQHPFLKGGQQFVLFDLNQIVERGRIGHDQNHGRRSRPFSSSSCKVAMSRSRSSIE